MKRLIKRLIGIFGYEIRKKQIIRSNIYDDISNSLELRGLIDMTEGMISYEEANLLYDLAREVTDGCIVEVGTYRGRSAVALGRGSLDGNCVPVYAIDPHEEYLGELGGKFGPPDRGAFYKAMLDSSCYHIVRLVNLSSEYITTNWDKKVALLWLDGDHTYDGLKRDFDCWSKYLTSKAVIVFDDSSNTDLDPITFINELVEREHYEVIHQIGKITAIQKEDNRIIAE